MRAFVAALVLLTSVAVPVEAQMAASDSAAAEAEVRKLSDDEVTAFLKNDRAAMARLWSDDFVVTNPLNRFVTKQQVLAMVDSGMLRLPTFKRTTEYAHVYGDVVILAGSEDVVWGGKMPNAGKPDHLRFTAIWMKQNGRWQQIARHANIVPPQPAAPRPTS
jgi:uncharacterized protein (TIGR02246 family)